MSRLARGFALGASCALAACQDVPTSFVVSVENGDGADRPLFILMRAYGASGVVYDINRLTPAPEATGQRLGTVVVFRRGSDRTLRLQAVGMRSEEDVISEGVATVTFAPGDQREATLLLVPGRLADLDADSVPDLIDDCLGVSNVEQGGPADGGSCAPRAAGAAAPGGAASSAR